MNEIVRLTGSTTLLHNEVGVFAVNTGFRENDLYSLVSNATNHWEGDPVFICGERLVSFGVNNELPQLIRRVMDENNLAPGILEREMGLLYGEGPQLYRVVVTEQGIGRQWIIDKEVDQWLKSWNFKRYIDMAMTEFKYMKGVFVKRTTTKGRRIGRGAIASLEVVPNTNARLGWVDSLLLDDVDTIFVGDFENNCYRKGLRGYPVYRHNNPFRHPTSIGYHNSYSFSRNFYSVPSYYGALKWIMRSSDIPDIIKYLTDNGIAVAYHVHSPAVYWDEKRDLLRRMYPSQSDVYIANKLDEIKTNIFDAISSVLAGKKNVGKFFETVDFPDPNTGAIVSWKIEPIDQKIKDFIDAQLKIAEKADSATTSGLGLHPSLSNIIVGGQLSSGSQMLYALKLYLASDVAIPEEIIFEPINQALEVNFPGKDIKMGFYHSIIKTEEDVSPSDRLKNNK